MKICLGSRCNQDEACRCAEGYSGVIEEYLREQAIKVSVPVSFFEPVRPDYLAELRENVCKYGSPAPNPEWKRIVDSQTVGGREAHHGSQGEETQKSEEIPVRPTRFTQIPSRHPCPCCQCQSQSDTDGEERKTVSVVGGEDQSQSQQSPGKEKEKISNCERCGKSIPYRLLKTETLATNELDEPISVLLICEECEFKNIQADADDLP